MCGYDFLLLDSRRAVAGFFHAVGGLSCLQQRRSAALERSGYFEEKTISEEVLL
jgi:hypothetical protein